MSDLSNYTKSQQNSLLLLLKYFPELKEATVISRARVDEMCTAINKTEFLGYPKFLLQAQYRISPGVYKFPKITHNKDEYQKEFIDELIENGIEPKF